MILDFERRLRQAENLKTNCLTMHYFDFSQNEYREHSTYELCSLCMILEGEKQISINKDCELLYDKNSFIVIPPNSNISVRANAHTRALVFGLDRGLIQEVKDRIDISSIPNEWLLEDPLYLHRWSSELKKSVKKILNVILYSEKDKKFLVELYAHELVYNLLQIKNVCQMLNLEDDSFVNLAAKYMKENYSLPVNVKMTARHFNMSEASFSQNFKRTAGINPKDYLTQLKLTKAAELLKQSNVTEAAFSLGYENISHFITLFKERYGMTPKQYQLTFLQGEKSANAEGLLS